MADKRKSGGIKDKIVKGARKGFIKGAIVLSGLGGMGTLTSCEKGDSLNEITQNQGTLEVNDDNIEQINLGHYDTKVVKRMNINISDPENTVMAMFVALNAINGTKPDIEINLNINPVGANNGLIQPGQVRYIPFEALSKCVSASKLGFIKHNNYQYNGYEFTMAETSTIQHLPSGIKFDFSTNIRTYDIGNLDVNLDGPLDAVVDAIHILQAAGFEITNRFPGSELQKALDASVNPYQPIAMSKSMLYITPEMIKNGRC
jgi:hypothetical protein